MDLSKLTRNVSLFVALSKIDSELEKRQRLSACPECHGPLHHAHYERKPVSFLRSCVRVCEKSVLMCLNQEDIYETSHQNHSSRLIATEGAI
jgi:uncharacterized protein YbaR (Trm112 family)